MSKPLFFNETLLYIANCLEIIFFFNLDSDEIAFNNNSFIMSEHRLTKAHKMNENNNTVLEQSKNHTEFVKSINNNTQKNDTNLLEIKNIIQSTIIKNASLKHKKKLNANCLNKYEPVCGSNFITYRNKCIFDQFAKHFNIWDSSEIQQKKLKILHNGECCNHNCPLVYEPVCDNRSESHLVKIKTNFFAFAFINNLIK